MADAGILDATALDLPEADRPGVDTATMDGSTADGAAEDAALDAAPGDAAEVDATRHDAALAPDAPPPTDATSVEDAPLPLDAVSGSDLATGVDGSESGDALAPEDASTAADAGVGTDAGEVEDAAGNTDIGGSDASSCVDDDSDGHLAQACGGDDCDDSPATGASCFNSCTIFYVDADGDGRGRTDAAIVACSVPAGHAAEAGDCDDANPYCRDDCVDGDGDLVCRDLDCDDSLATGAVCFDTCTIFYRDADGDGLGWAAGVGFACALPAGYTAVAGDCDDANAGCDSDCTDRDGDSHCVNHDCDDSLATGAACFDSCLTFFRDIDGDGLGDDALTTQACTQPTGWVGSGGDCLDSTADCTTDCSDANSNGTPDCAEACADADGDSYPDKSCGGTDCDDGRSAVHPGAPEICDNGLDDDCDVTTPDRFDADGDGVTCEADCDESRALCTTDCTNLDGDVACAPFDCDDSVATGASCRSGCGTYYRDADVDTYGDPTLSVQACSVPSGYVANSSDCDDGKVLCTTVCTNLDGDAACAPFDCDDSASTGASCQSGCGTSYRDADGDSLGDPLLGAQACAAPSGYVANSSDCDDSRALCTTDCTNLDGDLACAPFDCDDSVATGASCHSGCATYHRDADGDTFGDPLLGILACVAPPGYIADSSDCDDGNAAAYPGATEICDGVADEDCDTLDDASDPDCAPTIERCDNLVDDDGNGQVDCADAACADDPRCFGNRCAHPIVLAQSGSVDVDTRSFTDDFAVSCQPADGLDAVFALTLTATSDLHLDTEGSDDDTILTLRGGPCAGGAEQVCNDDVNAVRTWSRIERSAVPAGTYYVVADSAAGSAGGRLILHVEVVVNPVDTRMAVAADPLLRMPGTQPEQGVTVESPGRCLNCHEGYVATSRIEPGDGWQGSMMAHAARDFLFFAAMTVAAQDSIWALGRPNATDLCERCHFPQGWVERRSDPTNASRMTGADFDGVSCDVCHQMWNPFFEDTQSGAREGSDWAGYWDEKNVFDPPSSVQALTTYNDDLALSGSVPLFFGGLFFATDHRPVSPLYVEAGGGQYYISPGGQKRASFADASATHFMRYSRFHKSKYFCNSCHDVSNAALANLGHQAGDPLLPSEATPASSYFHIERTFSEFMLSAYGAEGGAAGSGVYAPGMFETSQPGNAIASCQDCHMRDVEGVACNKSGRLSRKSQSLEHPESGLAMHDQTGGNMWVPWVLASAVTGSPNYDATNAALLGQGAAVLTLDLGLGQGIATDHLLAGVDRAHQNLQDAATIDGLQYDAGTGRIQFRVTNHTGHKLISGFPEGRRMFVNIRLYDAGGALVYEVNPYDGTAATLRGLDPAASPASPPLTAQQRHDDQLVYEVQSSSTLTGEDHTFHIVLADGRHKDNRIPPRGFDVSRATARLVQPVWGGVDALDYFTPAEYAGGYDEVALDLPTGAARAEVALYYQTTSREFIEFLRDQINGDGTSLRSPTLAGNAVAYVVGSDPFFDGLRAWGDTLWQLWWHNRNVPGAAPVRMATASTP